VYLSIISFIWSFFSLLWIFGFYLIVHRQNFFAYHLVNIVPTIVGDHLGDLADFQIEHGTCAGGSRCAAHAGKLTVGESIFMLAASNASFCSLVTSSPAAARSRRLSASLVQFLLALFLLRFIRRSLGFLLLVGQLFLRIGFLRSFLLVARNEKPVQ